MRTANKQRMSTQTMVLGAMMTALVVVFQCLATYTTFFGPFSTAIGLIPIVIGAAMCGPLMGAWLGLCFGVVVIATGGANLFFAFSIVGTLVTVLAKGIFCGFSAGLVHNLLNKWNKTVAVVAASVICPVVNTGIFLLGSALFFLPHANAIADMLAMDVTGFELFLALAMANFALELLMNILLSPVVVRLLDIWGKNKRRKKV